MRYLLINPNYPPPLVGGSLVYMYNLVENFYGSIDILTGPLPEGAEEITDERHNMVRSRFITPSFDPTRLDLLINYIYIPIWFIVRRLFIKYDLVIANAGVIGSCIVVVLSKILGIPVIGMGYAEELTMPLKGKGLKNIIKRSLIRYSYPKFDGFIACCKFTADVAESVGVSKDKIIVIPVMINENKISKNIDSQTNRQRDFGKNHRILSVGTLVERKGFHYIIEAIRMLRDEMPDVTLSIVGKGPDRDRLANLIHEYGLEDNVFLMGTLNDDELGELYRESGLFVLAHMMLEDGNTEGCPTVFIEASANGIPVIGGIEGGASDAIDDGVNGYLVDPRNIRVLKEKIKEILGNPDLAEKMGTAGKIKIKNDHNPIKAGERFGRFIKQVVPDKSVA